jgi:hypothetical protein
VRPADTGGVGLPSGPGVILLMPDELRRGATRLTDTAQQLKLPVLGCLAVPELGPGCGDVSGELSSVQQLLTRQSQQLTSSAAELQKRAFFADIADAMIAGVPLTAPQTATLFKYLNENGSLKYAPKWEREKLGQYVGTTYAKTFHDPKSLVALAHLLQHNETDPSFSQGFVYGFGGKNFTEVPRVLQAMEYAGRVPMGEQDPNVDTHLAAVLAAQGYKLQDDPRSLLSAFAMSLAMGTSAADMNKKGSPLAGTEDDIVSSSDRWAVAQLLSGDHVYGTRFLVDAFHHQVIPAVAEDSNDYMQGQSPLSSDLPIGGMHGHPLTTDPKTIILNALARNGEASAQALTSPLDKPVFFQTPYGPLTSSDPMEALYHGHWEDDGKAFSQVYTSAENQLHADAGVPGDPLIAGHLDADQLAKIQQANGLTKSLIDQTLSADHTLGSMTDALASDLGHHDMNSLYRSAGAMDPSSNVWVGTAEQNGALKMGLQPLRDLMVQIADHSSADATFREAAANTQAQIILDNTQHAPAAGTSGWVGDLAAFNSTLMSAHDVQLQDTFDGKDAQHKLIFSFINDVAGKVADAVPGGDIVAGHLIDSLDDATAPSEEALHLQTGHADGVMINNLKAAIANGYYDNGLITAHDVPGSLLQSDPEHPYQRLVSYSGLHDQATIGEYEDWMSHNPAVLHLTQEPNQTIGTTMEFVRENLGDR